MQHPSIEQMKKCLDVWGVPYSQTGDKTYRQIERDMCVCNVQQLLDVLAAENISPKDASVEVVIRRNQYEPDTDEWTVLIVSYPSTVTKEESEKSILNAYTRYTSLREHHIDLMLHYANEYGYTVKKEK